MAQVIKFISDIDGKQFDTEAEQLAHDAALNHKASIDAFLDVNYPHNGPKSGPARAIAGKAIAKWIAAQG